MRRFLLSFLASLTAVTIALGFPALASAAPTLPDWFNRFNNYVERYGSSSLPKHTSQVLNGDYVRSVMFGSAPAAPSGTSVTDAIKGGFSDFYVPDSSGSIHRISMSDYQHELADTFSESYRSQASIADQAGASMQDYLKAQSAKITTTSGEMSRAAKATGIKPSTLYSTAKSDAGVIQVSGKELATNMSKIRDTSGNVIDTTGTALSEQTVKAGFLGSAARIAGTAFAIAGAAQFGLALGSNVASLFGIDQETECQTITNGVARYLLDIGAICRSYDDSLLSHAGLDKFQYDGLCFRTNYHDVWYVSCLDSLDFPNFYVSGHVMRGTPVPGDNLGLGPVAGLNFSAGSLPAHPAYYFVQTGRSDSGFVYTGNHACTVRDTDCLSKAMSGLVSAETNSGYSPADFNGRDRSPTDFSTKVISQKAVPKVTVQGSDGKTYSATGHSQSQGGRMSLPSVPLPDGVTPRSVEVQKTAPDGTQVTVVPQTDVEAKADTGPDSSIDIGDGTLDLIDQATGKSCYLEAYACADWPAQVMDKTGTAVTLSNKSTTAQHADMPYKCSWQSGGKTTELTIGECTALSHAFVQDNVQQGTTSSDPETGVKSGDKTDTDPDGDVSYGQCVTTGVSWNPVSWVFVPVKCALKWAFEPDQDNLTTKTVMVQQQAHYSLPGKLQQTFVASLPDQQTDECLGPEVNLRAMGYTLFDHSHPLSVCNGSGLDFLPTISKIVITLFAGIGAIFIIRHHISQVAGMDDTGGTS